MALLIAPLMLEKDYTYRSQEVFLSVEDFENFKHDLKLMVYEDNLKLNSFDVLASDPPIIVNFSIDVPHNYEFPYGKPIEALWERIFTVFLIGLVTGFFLIFVVPMCILGW